MNRGSIGLAVLFALFVLFTAGCASSPRPPRGVSGPVEWEVADIRQSRTPDGREIRWDYTIFLRETDGRRIRFETLQLGAERAYLQGEAREEQFQRELAPRSELRLQRYYVIYFLAFAAPSFDWPTPGGSEGARVTHRFIGRDETGRRVVTEVRVRLDPGVGR